MFVYVNVYNSDEFKNLDDMIVGQVGTMPEALGLSHDLSERGSLLSGFASPIGPLPLT